MKLKTWTVGNGPRTAVLVHGASKSSDVWRDFAAELVERHDLTVMLLDQRGHGRSPRADSYAIDDFVGDLVESVPTGLDFFIGASLGGVAGAWAADRLKPRRLIALDPGFFIAPALVTMAKTFNALGPFKRRVNEWMLRVPGAIPKGSAPDAFERVREMTRQWDIDMMLPLVRSGLAKPFPIAQPAVPSTVVVIENSIVVPVEMAERLAALGWDMRLMPGVTHDMHLQDPRGVVAFLDDVLRKKD